LNDPKQHYEDWYDYYERLQKILETPEVSSPGETEPLGRAL